MATLRVAPDILEHILDFPECVRITDVQKDDNGTFLFHIEGTNPETDEDLGDANLDVIYTQDDTGVYFGGFRPA